MKVSTLLLLCCTLVVHRAIAVDLQHATEYQQDTEMAETNTETDAARGRRDVIEEEKFYNIRSDTRKDNYQPAPWVPGPLPPEDPTTKVTLTLNKDVLPLYHTTEKVTDKPTGRGARASNENWIKLPYPGRDEIERDNILTPPQPSGELINSRMPRVNFVTQNKVLETSESRNDKESIQRSSRNDDSIRTDFVRPGEEDRKVPKPVYPRQAAYYPEESRRYYDDRMYPDDLYRRDPYYDLYDKRRFYPSNPVYPGSRAVDRHDDGYDSYIPRKPKRIIYYTHLPEVVRTPPSVDLRYRYSVDPYRPDDYYPRNGRYDYRFRNPNSRYPHAPLRKEERIYRDLAGSGTAQKDKKIDEKVTAAPVLPQKEDNTKSYANSNRNPARNLINSHQYHDSVDVHYNEPLSHKSFQDVVRPDDSYLRYHEPLFQSAIDDPYRQKY